MNKLLTEQIINHVFSGFCLIPSNSFQDSFKSIKSKEYLLDCKLSFEDQNNQEITNKVWGIKLNVENQDLKILVGDCSIEEGITEYAAIVNLQDSPTYGLYSVYGKSLDSQALIAASVDQKGWIVCSTYLQATFLSAMEHVKEIGFSWEKCREFQPQFESLQSFIKFHSEFHEEEYEGKEDRL